MVTPNLYKDRAFDGHATKIGCQMTIHCLVALVGDRMMIHLLMIWKIELNFISTNQKKIERSKQKTNFINFYNKNQSLTWIVNTR